MRKSRVKFLVLTWNLILPAVLVHTPALAASKSITQADLKSHFEKFRQARAASASKTKPVYARISEPKEIVHTYVSGVLETKSKEAQEGAMVVQNICPATGNEEYLVDGAKFAKLYRLIASQVSQLPGWDRKRRAYKKYAPAGEPRIVMQLLPGDFGGASSISFPSPWGQAMIAEPGDFLVEDKGSYYRVARQSFHCTYTVGR